MITNMISSMPYGFSMSYSWHLSIYSMQSLCPLVGSYLQHSKTLDRNFRGTSVRALSTFLETASKIGNSKV